MGEKTATSVKKQTKQGATVTTVSSGNKSSAGAPEVVSIEFDAARLGIFYDSSAILTKVKPEGPASKAGVQVGWKVGKVSGKACKTGGDIKSNLEAAMKRKKKFTIEFVVPPPQPDTVAPKAAVDESPVEKEGKDSSESPKDGAAGGHQDPALEGVEAKPLVEGGEATPSAGTEDNTSPPTEGGDEIKTDGEGTGGLSEKEAVETAEAAEKAAEEAEAARLKAEAEARANGEVVLKYSMYDEKFPIQNGSTTSEAIDDVYALSFVMPNAKIKLSKLSPADVAQQGLDDGPPYIPEDPPGTYLGLLADDTYWVYALQTPEELAADAERSKAWLERNKQLGAEAAAADSSASRKEGCSCLYGNPCVDKYVCQDWNNRNEVAKKNGWKGFS